MSLLYSVITCHFINLNKCHLPKLFKKKFATKGLIHLIRDKKLNIYCDIKIYYGY